MPPSAGPTPVRLEIRAVEIAVCGSRLVRIAATIADGRVRVEDLASGEHREVSLADLSSRQSGAIGVALDTQAEVGRGACDAVWQSAAGREANRRCAARNLPAIARGTVLRRIHALDPETVARRRFGAQHAREKVSAAPGTFIVDNALVVIQIDHTRVDLHVLDEEYRRPIGRPWITVATDVPTRIVWGIYLTLDEPSELSVTLCLPHAVLPNESWLLERKIQAEQPIWGVPQCVHADNGSDFTGEALRRGCEDYGIRLEFRPPGRAHFGGHIERLIGTLMQYNDGSNEPSMGTSGLRRSRLP